MIYFFNYLNVNAVGVGWYVVSAKALGVGEKVRSSTGGGVGGAIL